MKKFIFTFTILLLSAWLIGFVFFARAIYSYPTDQDTKTQAIVALTGGSHRIAEAIRLLNEKKSEKLFISGVGKDISLPLIEKQNHIAIKDNSSVFIGRKATNTIGNALETKDWLKDNHINSIRLVTSHYHIPRSIIEFQNANPGIQIIVHPVYSEKILKKWWKSWRTFSLIFMEYNKFLYVYVRSKIQNI